MLVGSQIRGLGFLLHAREATTQSTTTIRATTNNHNSEATTGHAYKKIDTKGSLDDSIQKLLTSGSLQFHKSANLIISKCSQCVVARIMPLKNANSSTPMKHEKNKSKLACNRIMQPLTVGWTEVTFSSDLSGRPKVAVHWTVSPPLVPCFPTYLEVSGRHHDLLRL